MSSDNKYLFCNHDFLSASHSGLQAENRDKGLPGSVPLYPQYLEHMVRVQVARFGDEAAKVQKLRKGTKQWSQA